ncbi:hypothetical protein PAMA_007577 [Pampus argenteus]
MAFASCIKDKLMSGNDVNNNNNNNQRSADCPLLLRASTSTTSSSTSPPLHLSPSALRFRSAGSLGRTLTSSNCRTGGWSGLGERVLDVSRADHQMLGTRGRCCPQTRRGGRRAQQ